ncbi:hypothetical protein AVEN_116532-1 [Araneus ventricosus]|uniref:Uncharacterized protein n=1 Tax=Araneus ventricosus TaxID=182803 RepID=A0A4Y2TMD3_ARAVE|nr:hypothetical protein AVEN_86125-1 [Araneus ventricosus]GBO00256.1 hypothetical protein AVEN_116532-1 [Araneus ventricosus]
MTRTTSELAPTSTNFRATLTGRRLATTYDLSCSRPHTRRIFSGTGFESATLRSRGRDLTTRPPWPHALSERVYKDCVWIRESSVDKLERL